MRAICVLVMTLLGCSRGDHQRYVPASALAREALTASLESWAAGEQTPRLASGQPGLQFADSLRARRNLERFEIVGELPIQDGRRFEVQLHLRNPAGSEKAEYIVLGIDPLWIIRQEDYNMITHWDHPMPQERAPSPIAAPPDPEGATTDE
jgi:hypothetical protein